MRRAFLIKSRRRSMRGASLIEVLIALLVFSVGALAVLQMTLGSFSINDHSRNIDGASNVARSQMELLLGLPYDDPLLVDTNADGVAGLGTADPASADFAEVSGRYQLCWNVANNQPVNNTKTISVLAIWDDSVGAGRRVVYQTIRVEN